MSNQSLPPLPTGSSDSPELTEAEIQAILDNLAIPENMTRQAANQAQDSLHQGDALLDAMHGGAVDLSAGGAGTRRLRRSQHPGDRAGCHPGHCGAAPPVGPGTLPGRRRLPRLGERQPRPDRPGPGFARGRPRARNCRPSPNPIRPVHAHPGRPPGPDLPPIPAPRCPAHDP